ncbi:MAG: GNAT family N-acetyltransferase, partial [Alphaproteobacteria bacterium]|nr:GNAT family N-acetyltransferase [Alphaproteobacteria bacterium]
MKTSLRGRGGVARVGPADLDDLRAFQRRHFGPDSRQADEAAFAWRFERHPLRGPDGPDLWIARREGQVVGQQAILPFPLRVGDGERRAAWAIDLMVAPEWRLCGVGPALYGEVQQSEATLCGLGVSDDALPAFRRAGWLDLDRVPRWLRLL